MANNSGAGARTWHAYLSAIATNSSPAVNARDRIGRGPWQNAKGVVIAHTIAELRSKNNLNKQTALTEKGDLISGRDDPVNMHDILTGSTPDGHSSSSSGDTTCGNWTNGSNAGSAIVGHHDRKGLRNDAASVSWNSSHATRGCSLDGLKSTGGGGLLYCFAIN